MYVSSKAWSRVLEARSDIYMFTRLQLATETRVKLYSPFAGADLAAAIGILLFLLLIVLLRLRIQTTFGCLLGTLAVSVFEQFKVREDDGRWCDELLAYVDQPVLVGGG